VTGGAPGGVTEERYDPTIPPEKQKVTYQAKDGTLKTVTKAELQEQMETSEKLMESLEATYEENHREREQALEDLGISVDKGSVGVHTPKKVRARYALAAR
jgi:kinesin family protein 1